MFRYPFSRKDTLEMIYGQYTTHDPVRVHFYCPQVLYPGQRPRGWECPSTYNYLLSCKLLDSISYDPEDSSIGLLRHLSSLTPTSPSQSSCLPRSSYRPSFLPSCDVESRLPTLLHSVHSPPVCTTSVYTRPTLKGSVSPTRRRGLERQRDRQRES